MEQTIQTQVLVIGAGISGLSTAHFLKKNGIKTHIIEKNSYFGGSIISEKKDGFLVDYGPNSALETTPLLKEMFADLNIDNDMLYANPSSKNRYILKNGKLVALPLNPAKFIATKLFSPTAKARLLMEPFIKRGNENDDESLAHFVSRRLGGEFLDYAIDPFVAGVFAGTPETLSVKSAFGKLWQLEQEYGSLIRGAILGAKKRKKSAEKSKQSAKMFSFKSGMQTIVIALANEFRGSVFADSVINNIEQKNGKYLISVNAGGSARVFETDAVIFTIPSHSFSEIPFTSALMPYFEKIYYPPVTMLFLGWKENPSKFPLDGFGFLIPSKEKRNILGAIWSSSIFPNRAPEGGAAFTVFMGGARQPENALLPLEQVEVLALKDLHSILGITNKPDYVATKLWNRAIPQYQIYHDKIIGEIESYENVHPGLFFSGNYRGGISVADCVKQAKENELRIAKYLNENG